MDKTHEKKLIENARQQAMGRKQAAQVSEFQLTSRFSDSSEGSMVLGETADVESSNHEFDSFQPGTLVNQYRIVRKIGEGGMGEVYLAQHSKFMSRLYAVKFLRRDLVDAATKDRFEAEIAAMEVLKHDNIVYAHDAGEFQGASYLVMDYVEGKSIKAFAAGETLRFNDSAEIIRQTALGLQHANENGMVHRDIKPSNLMLSTEGLIKILDMGLAKITEATSAPLTGTQQVLGTPDYMAPEQWQSTKTVDIRADIYSLGCTFYYLLAGHAPYEDDEHSSLATKLSGHLQEQPPEIPTLTTNAGLEQIDFVLKKMLEKDPANRFHEPLEVAQALAPFCEGADLLQLTSNVEPISIPKFDTRSIQDELEDTQTRMPSASPATLKPGLDTEHKPKRGSAWWAVLTIAMSVLFVSAIYWAQATGFFGLSQEDNQTSFNSKEPGYFSVRYISRVKLGLPADHPEQELIDQGQIGVAAFTARLGDLAKVEFALDNPMYVYLIALNPTDDPKFRIQLCYPATQTELPQRLSELTYPASEKSYFPMTDGIGQVAFVLIKSETPLPEFKKWKSENLGNDFPWKVSNQTGVWTIGENGELKRRIAQNNQAAFRGDILEVKSDVLSKSLEYLRSKLVEVEVLAFPVISD